MEKRALPQGSYQPAIWWAHDGAGTWILLETPDAWVRFRDDPDIQWELVCRPIADWRIAVQALPAPQDAPWYNGPGGVRDG